MLPLLLAVAPLLLASPVVGAPRLLERDDVDCSAVVTTVTVPTTVYVTRSAQEQYSPQDATVSVSSANVPAATTAVSLTNPSATAQSSAASSSKNSTSRGIYRNVLYFTNWYV
jgi:hypothetical protein